MFLLLRIKYYVRLVIREFNKELSMTYNILFFICTSTSVHFVAL